MIFGCGEGSGAGDGRSRLLARAALGCLVGVAAALIVQTIAGR